MNVFNIWVGEVTGADESGMTGFAIEVTIDLLTIIWGHILVTIIAIDFVFGVALDNFKVHEKVNRV